jgi:hypothetical protein
MAITYTQQPSGKLGANSPLIYQVNDASQKATAGFYYKFEVFVWTGSTTIPVTPIATLTKLPDAYADGRAYMDISRLVTQYVKTNYLVFGALTPLIDLGAYWVQIKVSGFNTAGGTTPVSVAVNSNRILATRGYSFTKDGINSAFAQNVYTDRTQILLTPDTTIDYLWYNQSGVSSVTIGATTITPTAGTLSTQQIQGFEIKTALTTAGLWGTNCNIIFNLSGGGTQTIPVIFDCATRYGAYSVLFLNRFGVYEGMTFNGVYQPSWAVNREDYQTALFTNSDLTSAWAVGMRQTRQFNIQSKENMVISTNWIPESYVTYMGQLMMSEAITFAYDGIYYGVNCTDMNMERKRVTNAKLIQYTLNLEYSQPYINKIVR